jgi:hypothetical protein
MDRKLRTCSICQQNYYGFGHNAWPYQGRCCDACNSRAVWPARIMMGQLHQRRMVATSNGGAVEWWQPDGPYDEADTVEEFKAELSGFLSGWKNKPIIEHVSLMYHVLLTAEGVYVDVIFEPEDRPIPKLVVEGE